MAIWIDGKAQARALRETVADEVRRLGAHQGPVPGLAAVLVGDDPASQVYVRRKGEHAREVGMRSFEHCLPASTPQGELLSLIATLNRDPSVHGILVQLPLPAHIDPEAIIDAIDPAKDVDGFHPLNVGALAAGGEGLAPCTPLGCIRLLQSHLGELTGKHAVVLGRSRIVGRPLASLLLREDCTVTVAHSKTSNPAKVCRQGDILVAAVGQPGLVQGDWVKAGATVIDVGITRLGDGDSRRLVGDVDAACVSRVAGALTPVPGGVGPMTIACLLHNTLIAACRQHGLPDPHDRAPSERLHLTHPHE
ncbi:bifunctional methylenetetrahydrofolate dehydrogenase/methenyltetrahydrofolate cyclohydrolase FolD [Halomonas sp. M4R1S46]|uniref:bifunctional methylenetetrahydrofolate dehydrogenase/methenyltetrahydrofolate cyclohydrolase FolD n=1 Tax=Halomonas sp. M4R1S46 TaxID=2982692 RepID=UPI0021E455EE|nr:bifunctional methylenetetrahydrofolate dehydrogenase/methenyltetrahydrofolate cyclohydrolase FolD [Halomonas sp. M4R1S46]UYG05995.1 bifunctional methylenetetrahydrofolate dehydrogenase/methenyltetrahydrofolate cyclohydrolase FolD [Halomonas sp. M4R1S46]